MTLNRLLWLLNRPSRLLGWLLLVGVMLLLGWLGLRRGVVGGAWDQLWVEVGEIAKGMLPSPSPSPSAAP